MATIKEGETDYITDQALVTSIESGQLDPNTVKSRTYARQAVNLKTATTINQIYQSEPYMTGFFQLETLERDASSASAPATNTVTYTEAQSVTPLVAIYSVKQESYITGAYIQEKYLLPIPTVPYGSDVYTRYNNTGQIKLTIYVSVGLTGFTITQSDYIRDDGTPGSITDRVRHTYVYEIYLVPEDVVNVIP